jgi:hypothetical protein
VKPEEKREKIEERKGEEKKSIIAQSLRRHIHTLDKHKDHVRTLPTLLQKAAFDRNMKPQASPKDDKGFLQLVHAFQAPTYLFCQFTPISIFV